MQRGADLNVRDNSGVTALISACDKGHTELGLALMDRGADVNVMANNGKTSVILACDKGHIELAKELFMHGADRNNDGLTGSSLGMFKEALALAEAAEADRAFSSFKNASCGDDDGDDDL